MSGRRGFLLCALLSTILLSSRGKTSAAQEASSASVPARERGLPALLSWGDVDGDGRPELAAVGGDGRLQLFLNAGEGRFQEATEQVGLLDVANASFASWADYDGDGHQDLFVGARSGASRLFRNEGATFLDWTAASGLVVDGEVLSARWLDYDGDHRLDLHVVQEGANRLLRGIEGGFFEAVVLPVLPLPAESVPSTSDALGSPPVIDEQKGSGFETGAEDSSTPSRSSTRPSVSVARAVAGAGSGGSVGGPIVWSLGTCEDELTDQAGGSCLMASSSPTMGMLYPISQELFVAPSGDIGLGTVSPSHRLTVQSPNGNALRLMANGTSGSNARLNFGNGDFVYLHEDIDDSLRIHALGRTAIMGGPVGIGKPDPEATLDVYANELPQIALHSGQSAHCLISIATCAGCFSSVATPGDVVIDARNDNTQDLILQAANSNDPSIRFVLKSGGAEVERMTIRNNGNVGIGTNSPSQKLDVNGGLVVDGTTLFVDPVNDRVGIGMIPASGARLDVNGRARVKTLEIVGGADIVEGFTSTEPALEPGTVVVIDPESLGVVSSSTPYDQKVAGIVSGAAGIRAGLRLGQEGVTDGDTVVAMIGRVYVKCSAENGAIRPGDRLTTASLTGHAMKATDPERCDGAVIGKAMSSLAEGNGLVLVLVNLQ